MKQTRNLVCCIALFVLFLSFLGCARTGETQSVDRQHRKRHHEDHENQRRATTTEGIVTLSEDEIQAIDLTTAPAEYRPVGHQLAAMGKVLADPGLMAIVSYAFPARVTEAHVGIGDWVTAGQALVTLQSEEVGDAKAEFYGAQAGLELALANFERARLLHERGVGAKKDLLSGEAELKVADAQLDSAEKKLHLLGFSEAQMREMAETHQVNPEITLFSPISGKAARIDAVRGTMIDQGHEILLILDPSRLVVDAEIHERDIALVDVNQAVEIEVPAFPGERFGGSISYVGDVLNDATRTLTVRTKVANTDGRLKPGMFANVNIELDVQTDAVVVHASAVIHDSRDRVLVFIAENGSYDARLVEIGDEQDGLVEILNGIEAGEEVVTQGAYQLKARLREGPLSTGHTH